MVKDMEKRLYIAPALLLRKVCMESVMQASITIYLGEENVVTDDDQVFSRDIELRDVWED
jgi:hypothetical protein